MDAFLATLCAVGVCENWDRIRPDFLLSEDGLCKLCMDKGRYATREDLSIRVVHK